MDKNPFAEIVEQVLKTQEFKPNILNETPVQVFDGSKLQDFTILTLDAGSMLKIVNRSKMVNGSVDIYQHTADTLKYRVKEIEDGKEFLSTNSMMYVNDILDKIIEVDKGKESGLRVVKPK